MTGLTLICSPGLASQVSVKHRTPEQNAVVCDYVDVHHGQVGVEHRTPERNRDIDCANVRADMHHDIKGYRRSRCPTVSFLRCAATLHMPLITGEDGSDINLDESMRELKSWGESHQKRFHRHTCQNHLLRMEQPLKYVRRHARPDAAAAAPFSFSFCFKRACTVYDDSQPPPTP